MLDIFDLMRKDKGITSAIDRLVDAIEQEPAVEDPTYKHDCSDCVFLGPYKVGPLRGGWEAVFTVNEETRIFDLWIHGRTYLIFRWEDAVAFEPHHSEIKDTFHVVTVEQVEAARDRLAPYHPVVEALRRAKARGLA